jgi:putative MATE family efflux protein
MVVQAGIGLLETYFIGKLGVDALAGVAMVFPVLMLAQMMSAGAMGGGISSAVARALGGGKREQASELAWYAAAIALALGLSTMVLVLVGGPALYSAMGGRNGSLAAAILYSQVIFAGAPFLWMFNALANVIRGTGNMAFPATVTCLGAVLLVPLSPLLIFGWGPFPQLGIVGGAVAVVGYYAIGSAVFATYIWSGRSALKPPRRMPAWRWAPARDILRVGAVASLVTVTTNVTIATATAYVGLYGPAAVAGYGIGSRLEYLLVPLVFGLGGPLVAMVGTNIGAGQKERALRIAWTGAFVAGGLTEFVGIAAFLFPEAWLRLFGDDPAMIASGRLYLHIVAPFYGLFGLGLALYFASQGAGRLGWPLIGGVLRLTVAVCGGFIALRLGGGLPGVFWALAAALATFAAVNATAIASGSWFRTRAVPLPPAPAPAA